MCQVCGSENVHAAPPGVHGPCVHSDLVRSVALGQDFVLSGSYDLSIKVRTWPPFFSFSEFLISYPRRFGTVGVERS